MKVTKVRTKFELPKRFSSSLALLLIHFSKSYSVYNKLLYITYTDHYLVLRGISLIERTWEISILISTVN